MAFWKIFSRKKYPSKLDVALNKLMQNTGYVLAALCAEWIAMYYMYGKYLQEQCKGKCVVKRINTYLRTGQDNFVKVT